MPRNQGIVFFQAFQVSARIALQNGLDFCSGGLSHGDELKNGKVYTVFPPEFLDEEILSFMDKRGMAF